MMPAALVGRMASRILAANAEAEEASARAEAAVRRGDPVAALRESKDGLKRSAAALELWALAGDLTLLVDVAREVRRLDRAAASRRVDA